MEQSLKDDYKNRIKVIRKEAIDFDFVKVGAIKDVLKENVLTLDIKDLTGLKAKVTSFDYYSEDKYQFIGEFTGKNEGSIILISDTLGIYGQIDIGERVFELNSIEGGNVSILSEAKKDSPFYCGTKDKEKDKKEVKDINIEERNSPCPFPQTRVLVVFTQNALNSAGNIATIQNRVNTGIAAFNSANNVSNVTNPHANLIVSAIEQTGYVELFRNVGLNLQDQNALLQQLDQFWTAFRNATLVRKQQTTSDIVFCACDHRWPGNLGIARAINANIDELSMAVGEIRSLHTDPILQHEIGHLFGGRHGDDNTPGQAHGHQYFANNLFRNTIMMQGGVAGIRENRWSNPNVTHFGVPNGVAGVSNVAAVISQNATAIAGIRQDPLTLYANMTGPAGVYNISTQSYVVNYGCSNNHVFTWSRSTNGINYTTFYNPTNTFTKTFTPADNGTFYVRCTISGSDGQTITVNRTTNVNVQSFLTSKNDNAINKANKDITIFPNPASELLTLIKEKPVKGKLGVVILDYQGKIFYSNNYNVTSDEEKFQVELPLLKLTNGIYIARITQNDISSNITFQILK